MCGIIGVFIGLQQQSLPQLNQPIDKSSVIVPHSSIVSGEVSKNHIDVTRLYYEDALLALKRLEYRGYDSAGIFVIASDLSQSHSSIQMVEHRVQVADTMQSTSDVSIDHLQLMAGGYAKRYRTVKSLSVLEKLCDIVPDVVLAHTRWATHGKVDIANTHPIIYGNIAIVHNGTIDNFAEIKQELIASGIDNFQTDTDSEVVAALAHYCLLCNEETTLLELGQKLFERLKGRYCAIITVLNIDDIEKNNSRDNKHKFGKTEVKFRQRTLIINAGLSLVVGRSAIKSYDVVNGGCTQNVSTISLPLGQNYIADEVLYVASDILAIADMVEEIMYMENGQILTIEQSFTHPNLDIAANFDINFTAHNSNVNPQSLYNLDEFDSFTEKEIFSQPEVLIDLIKYYKNINFNEILQKISVDSIHNVYIIACGSSLYAGQVARYFFEKYFGIYTFYEIASEFATRSPIVNSNTLYIVVSQSGETADVIEAINCIKKNENAKILAITNHSHSTVARIADAHLPICCGYEVAVAATKSFTAQIVTLLIFGSAIFYLKHTSEKNSKYCYNLEKKDNLLNESYESYESCFLDYLNLTEISKVIQYNIPDINSQIIELAEVISHSQNLIFAGRGCFYPLAMESALKMKELSYIPSDGVALGELKHGTLALVSEKMYIIVFAGLMEELGKTANGIEEIEARCGNIIFIGNANITSKIDDTDSFLKVIWQTNDNGSICNKNNRDLSARLKSGSVSVIKNNDAVCHTSWEESHANRIHRHCDLADALIEVLLSTIAYQLFACYTAKLRGNNVDRPRNLAKSLTVE